MRTSVTKIIVLLAVVFAGAGWALSSESKKAEITAGPALLALRGSKV